MRSLIRFIGILIVGLACVYLAAMFYFQVDVITPWFQNLPAAEAESIPIAILRKEPAPWKLSYKKLSLPSVLKESSGIAASKNFDRLYHINDSGSKPILYSTDLSGNLLASIVFSKLNIDTESLSLGPCLGTSCIFIGDQGDNFRRREVKSIYYKQENLLMESPEPHFHEKKFRYPDGLRFDSETLLVHPSSGNLYIISKSPRTFVFRLDASEFYESGESTLKPHLIIDSLKFIADGSISEDGESLLLIGGKDVYRLAIDFDSIPKKHHIPVSYSALNTIRLPQQEAISWLNHNNGFVYTTEATSRSLFRAIMIVATFDENSD